jgi:peptidoglycan/xylan/chitin deacetylase (PgdA/CDA1 family)
VRFLVRHFEMVAPASLGERRKRSSRITVLLTFDDGFRNHAEVVVPILTKYRVPAIFFIPSRHAEAGRYLWFSYLQMLQRWFPANGLRLGGEFMDMSENRRAQTMERLRQRLLELTPHPSAMYKVIEEELPRLEDFVSQEDLRDHAAGMTQEQIADVAQNPLFSVGVHTVDHPLLTRCDQLEAARQIQENRRWLEKLTGRGCDLIAYPVSDFNAVVLQRCRELSFSWGFSEQRRVQGDYRLQLPRAGVYFPSVTELGCKVRWGDLLTTLRDRPGSRIASLPTPPAATTHDLAGT